MVEEFLLENVVDRVDTTATVWMGLTLGCARCHDHKYDPISQKDYYQMIAFFNSVPEAGRAIKSGNSEPLCIAPTRDQQADLAQRESALTAAWDRVVASAATSDENVASKLLVDRQLVHRLLVHRMAWPSPADAATTSEGRADSGEKSTDATVPKTQPKQTATIRGRGGGPRR